MWTGVGLVLLPSLALALLVREVWQAEREARARDLAEHRQRLEQRASALARTLSRHASVFPEEPAERFALGLAHPEIEPGVEIDGRCDDWRPVDAPAQSRCEQALVAYDRAELLSHDPGAYDPRDFSFSFVAARQEAYLHLFVRVSDDQLAPRGRRLDEGDQLRLSVAVPEPGGATRPRRFVVAPGPDGSVTTYQVDRSWQREESPARRIAWGDPRLPVYRRPYGHWRTSAEGYALELRLPLRTLGPGWREAEIGLAVVDVDVRPERDEGLARQVMWVVPRREGAVAWLAPDAGRFEASLQGLDLHLDGRTLLVFDSRGRELFARPAAGEPIPVALRERIAALRFAILRGADAEPPDAMLTAARVGAADAAPLGVVVEWDASLPPPPALGSVLSEVPASAAALAAALVLLFLLLGDGRRLSRRILALVDDVGADLEVDDEIGELSRRLTALVERDRAQRSYLEQLPRILGHETLGPLGVVKMAIDELPGGDPRRDSARRAVRSIEDLIEDLREATSLEEALRKGERIHVDLVDFVREYAAAWQEANEAALVLALPDGSFRMQVIERRIEQLLDKLLDNARAFSDGRPLTLTLDGDADDAFLRVGNAGSQLPANVPVEQLFAPMSSWRKRTSERHLGLGLYVARLIAEQHGGEIRAWNEGDDGVVFEVRLPRRR